MPEPNRPYRWDLVRPDQLGSLLDGTSEPDLWFLDELVDCAAKILARSANGKLYFVGRSADSVFDLLSGALPGTDRLHQLPLSLRMVDLPLLDRLHPAEVAQLCANLAAHGLAPADLVRGSQPVVFADLVSSGTTFKTLHGLLRDWAEGERAAWPVIARRLRFVGVTIRTHTSPNTWRWQQHVDLSRSSVRNVSLDIGAWSYLGNNQQKLTGSFRRAVWADEKARDPRHDERTRQALAEAVAVVEAGRSRAVRNRLVRGLTAEPAVAEPWLRALVGQLH